MAAHIPLGILLPTALKLCRVTVGSEYRLNQYLYLADWYHALTTGDQLSDLVWQRWHWGAWLPELRQAAEELPEVTLRHFQCEESVGMTFHLAPGVDVDPLDPPARDALRTAAGHIVEMRYNELRRKIEKTLPLRRTKVGDVIEIEETARACRQHMFETGRRVGATPDAISESSEIPGADTPRAYSASR